MYAETITRTKMPTIAAWNGNSGIPPLAELETEMVELEEVEIAVVTLWLLVLLSLLDVLLDVLELVVVTADGAYWNVVVALTCGGYAPHVAFTVYVPATHAEVPPATRV